MTVAHLYTESFLFPPEQCLRFRLTLSTQYHAWMWLAVQINSLVALAVVWKSTGWKAEAYIALTFGSTRHQAFPKQTRAPGN